MSSNYAKYTGISGGSGGGGSGITALTGDVSATGPGSAAATVNAVGGQTATSVANAATAVAAATPNNTPLTLIERDTNGNFRANNIETAVTSTVSSGGTTNLTVSSTRTQILTGSTNQSFVLPDATTLVLGFTFDFINTNPSTGQLTVKDNSGTILYVAPPLCELFATCTSIGSAAGTWVISPQLNNAVTSDANAFVMAASQLLGFGNAGSLGTSNYSLGGDGSSYTLLNVNTGGTIHHRVNNSDVMSMTSSGLNLNSHPITSVTDPTNPQDAATKNYVDTHGGGSPGGLNTDVQFNNSGSFGGSSAFTWNGTSLTVNTSGGTPANFRLDNNGTFPTTYLGFNGQLEIQNQDTTINNVEYLSFSGSAGGGTSNAIIGCVNTSHSSATGDLFITTRSVSGLGTRMYITSGGNVGIGTTTPGNLLTVNGSIDLNGSTSGVFTQTANATTTSYGIVWPSSQGGAGTSLQNDGSGNLTWSPPLPSPFVANPSYTSDPNTWGVVGPFLGVDSSVTQAGSPPSAQYGATDVTASGVTAPTTVILGASLISSTPTNAPNQAGFVYINAGNVNHGSATSGGITMIGGNSDSGVASDFQYFGGNAASANPGGGFLIQTGHGTARGTIKFKDGSEGVTGSIWQNTDGAGTGSWASPNITQTLTAGGTISCTSTSGTAAFSNALQAAGAISTSTTTIIASGVYQGQTLVVVNVGSNTITLKSGGNTDLPGLTDYPLAASGSISFIWMGTTWYTMAASVN